MVSLQTVFNKLSTQTCILANYTLADLDRFLRLSAHFHTEIRLNTPAESHIPPFALPGYIEDLFVSVLSLDSPSVRKLWLALKAVIWAASTAESPTPVHLTSEELSLIDEIGTKAVNKKEKLASLMLYPPDSACSFCQQPFRLQTMSRIPVTLFRAKDGCKATRGYSSSFACTGCNIRYYHNYYVKNKVRHYYAPSVPSYIQIEDHTFVEAQLCDFFTILMLFSHVSQHNCSNILNYLISQSHPANDVVAESKLTLSGDQVFRAFALHALLRDCAEEGEYLLLPDDGDHDSRLKCAMESRNKRMVTDGQKLRMHACKRCEKKLEGKGYNGCRLMRAATMDGLTLGHYCCGVKNCHGELKGNRDHFCPEHASQAKICVVVGCNAKRVGKSQTCDNPEHRKLEDYRNSKGKSLFQLRSRLPTSLPNSIHTNEADLPEIPDPEDEDHKKAEDGNRPPKARFSRRRTHNEQLLVSCCGIILARGTMFAAESISGVKDFLKSVYPDRRDIPDVVFYDNNCSLQEHLHAQNDDFFKSVILPVDVFHFKSKHKITHEFCQKHCNPAQWQELVGENGEWVFNSSIAEQVNAWLGGYLAMTRDMVAHRYNFFLDEMIKRRNEITLERPDLRS